MRGWNRKHREMTEPERAILRQRIDQVKRKRLAEDAPSGLCAYCNQPIPDTRGPQAVYCTTYHRRQAWLRTERGIAFQKVANKRQWERRKQRRAEAIA